MHLFFIKENDNKLFKIYFNIFSINELITYLCYYYLSKINLGVNKKLRRYYISRYIIEIYINNYVQVHSYNEYWSCSNFW